MVVIKLNLLGKFFKHMKICSANLTKLLNYTHSSSNEIYTFIYLSLTLNDTDSKA